MINKSYILRILREDILRNLAERKEGLHITSIKTDSNISPFLISKALKELEKEKLIKERDHFITLSENGKRKSADILRKHLVLENYFKKTLDKVSAHRKAHILEHYVSEEVIKNIKKMDILKEKGIPSPSFSLRKEGLIADIDIINNHDLFERVVSMGIFPGKKIEILSIIPGIFVVKIANKKFALAKEIAEKIRILEI
jgi:Fe2+ transport system protein FeoA/predicted transcriptional regulator